MRCLRFSMFVSSLPFFAATAFAEPADVERLFGHNDVLQHESCEIDAEAMALHESLTVADLHADTLFWLGDPLEHSMHGQADVPGLRLGNVALQVFDAVTKSPGAEVPSGMCGDKAAV